MPTTTLYDYAALADASYAPAVFKKDGVTNEPIIQCDEDQRKAIRAKLGITIPTTWQHWTIELYQVGTSANGFQGVIFSKPDEVVCAYKGSKGGFFSRDKTQTAYDDWWVNDIQIGLNQIPSQAGAAREFLWSAQRIAGQRPVTLVGHSLGGGLAQLAGYYNSVPFVTFNAPGMAGNVGCRRSASGERGFNMILWKDPVGNAGQHIGKRERFGAVGTS